MTYVRRCSFSRCRKLMSKTRRLNARVCSDRCRVAYWRERKRDVALRAIGAYQ